MESGNCRDSEIPSTSLGPVKKKVPLLESEGENSDAEQTATVKKRRSENQAWTFVKKFESLKQAKDFVQSEKIWSFWRKHETSEGAKKYYRCNKVKRKGPQCSAQRYLLFDAASEAVLLYRTELDHDHDNKSVTNYGLSDHTKAEINKLHDLHLKPKSIMSQLANIKGIKMPKMSQLKTYLNDRRRVKYGSPTMSLGELEAWLLSHSTIPEDSHEPYVIGHEIFEENDSPRFRFALSTKYLIKLAGKVKIFHADATYKLVWQGFPVFVVGSTDKNKKFHPLGLGVATCEETDDFKLLFRAMKNNMSTLHPQYIQPEVLVCDGAKAIQNAFSEIFGENKVIRMCWAHAKTKIKARVEKCIRKNIQKEILADVDFLQAATDPNTFDLAAKAFLNKWEKETEFVKYFNEQWLTQNRNWYLGAHMGSPATNNALESTNRVIKDEHTLRERLPLSRFLTVAAELVQQWSLQYSSNSAEPMVFATSPTITLKDWTNAYQWAKLSKVINHTHSDDIFNFYEVPGGDTTEPRVFAKGWTDFESYKIQFFSKWQVALPQSADWEQGKCTCPSFYKNYMCKHIMGIAIRLKQASPPLEAKNIPIGQKRKRGRPSKSKPALIMQ